MSEPRKKLNELDDNEPLLQADVKAQEEEAAVAKPVIKSEQKQELKDMLEELKSLRSMLHA